VVEDNSNKLKRRVKMYKCTKCKKETNSFRWYEILGDNEYQSIGGDACRPKLSIAEAMADGSYGRYNKIFKTIDYVSFRHCFNCGHANYKRVKRLLGA
jgi:hypothetical protein